MLQYHSWSHSPVLSPLLPPMHTCSRCSETSGPGHFHGLSAHTHMANCDRISSTTLFRIQKHTLRFRFSVPVSHLQNEKEISMPHTSQDWDKTE